VVACGLQGTARFTGPRWAIDSLDPEIPTPTPEPSPSPEPSEPIASPPPLGSRGPALPNDVIEGALWILAVLATAIVALALWRWLTQRPPNVAPGLRDIGETSGTVTHPTAEPAIGLKPHLPLLRRGVEEALTF